MPRVQSRPAVHLPHPDRSQSEANCGAQVPRSQSGRLGQVRLVTSPNPHPCPMGLASLPLLSQQTGWERVKFLPGVPEPDCKVIPAFSSDLLRTYCVPGAQPSAAMGRK